MGDEEQSSNSFSDDGNSNVQIHKKMKIEKECEEIDCIDRISKLPNALIVQILSLLSISDAFRTTILSKRWQNLWTCIDNLIYDNEEYYYSDSSTVHKFIFLTDNVLPLLSSSKIKRLTLNFAFTYDDGVSYNPKIDKWLEFAVNKNVEDLYLKISYTVDATEDDQPYSLPQILCSSSSNRLHMTSPKCRRLELINQEHPDRQWGLFEVNMMQLVKRRTKDLLVRSY